MDQVAEQQFVRQHLGMDREYDAGQPSTQQRSVNAFWSTPQAPLEASPVAATNNALSPSKPVLQHISRPARSRQRLGEEAFSPLSAPPTDQTGAVTQLLQNMKARQDGGIPTSPDGPDTESAQVADERRRGLDLNAPQSSPEQPGGDGEQVSDLPRPLPVPIQAEPSLCACCPCVDSFTSASCFGSLCSVFTDWFGGRGTEEALSEMRQGVILPQDATKVNVRAVESMLNKQPEACVINVRCRRTDELTADSAIAHPMVRMHILDLRTGAYWRKKDRSRHAVSAYENLRHTGSTSAAGEKDEAGENSSIEHILPIMTHPYKLKSHGSFIPLWDENLLINEPLRQILDPHAMLFFEIVDFGPNVDLNQHPSGYFPIAWAFLKPLSARGEPNLGVNQQLQLYRYTNLGADRELNLPFFKSRSHTAFQKAGVPQVYYEWIWQKHTGRRRYPATFFIDFTGVAAPQREKVRGARPLLPTQIEEGRMDYPELMATITPMDEFVSSDPNTAAGQRARKKAVEQMSAVQKAAIVRRRKVAEECLIPNNLVHEISAGLTGCFCLRYSPDGRTLAAACGDGLMFTIKLYDSDTGTQLFTFVGHHDLIYDLAWNCMGTEIVTASSDGTAKIWAVDATRTLPAHQLRPQAIATLQHTGFVYACCFHPKLADKGIVLTGSFDGAIRFWNNRGDLLHTITDHTAHLNSIVFAPNGTRIFTGDADGTIRVWEDTHYTRATGSRGANADDTARPRIMDAPTSSTWDSRIRCLHTIAHDDLKGNIITCIRYHPRPERLVVYCRDNSLYIFSLLRYDIRKVLTGIPCHHHSLRCAISPDGDKLVAGGEDGNAYFWDLTHGELEKIMEVGYSAPLFDVTWHPSQHAVAFSSFGGDYPIRVFEYNATKDVRSAEELALNASQRQATARFNTREALPPMHVTGTNTGGLGASSRMASSARHTAAVMSDEEDDASTGRSALLGNTDRLGASAKRVHFTQNQ
jgi:WD40 repeat protein